MKVRLSIWLDESVEPTIVCEQPYDGPSSPQPSISTLGAAIDGAKLAAINIIYDSGIGALQKPPSPS